jgi:hypothetical protein
MVLWHGFKQLISCMTANTRLPFENNFWFILRPFLKCTNYIPWTSRKFLGWWVVKAELPRVQEPDKNYSHYSENCGANGVYVSDAVLQRCSTTDWIPCLLLFDSNDSLFV